MSEKLSTAILAIKCQDGIVLVTDSQATYVKDERVEAVIYAEQKMWSFPKNWHVCNSGDHKSLEIIKRVHEATKDKDNLTMDDIIKAFKSTSQHCPGKNHANFVIVCANELRYANWIPKQLFESNTASAYCAAGDGGPSALLAFNLFLQNHHIDTERMTMDEVLPYARAALAKAIAVNESVGGDIRIRKIPNDSTLDCNELFYPMPRGIEVYLEVRDTLYNILLALATLKHSKEKSEGKNKQFQNALQGAFQAFKDLHPGGITQSLYSALVEVVEQVRAELLNRNEVPTDILDEYIRTAIGGEDYEELCKVVSPVSQELSSVFERHLVALAILPTSALEFCPTSAFQPLKKAVTDLRGNSEDLKAIVTRVKETLSKVLSVSEADVEQMIHRKIHACLQECDVIDEDDNSLLDAVAVAPCLTDRDLMAKLKDYIMEVWLGQESFDGSTTKILHTIRSYFHLSHISRDFGMKVIAQTLQVCKESLKGYVTAEDFNSTLRNILVAMPLLNTNDDFDIATFMDAVKLARDGYEQPENDWVVNQLTDLARLTAQETKPNFSKHASAYEPTQRSVIPHESTRPGVQVDDQENLGEEGLPKYPDLEIAQLKFLLAMKTDNREDVTVKSQLAMKTDNREDVTVKSQLAMKTDNREDATVKSQLAMKTDNREDVTVKSQLAMKTDNREDATVKSQLAMKTDNREDATVKSQLAMKTDNREDVTVKSQLAMKTDNREDATVKSQLAMKTDNREDVTVKSQLAMKTDNREDVTVKSQLAMKTDNREDATVKSQLAMRTDNREDATVKSQLMGAISDNNMAPYYEDLCKELNWQLDDDLLSSMREANEEELKRLEGVQEDAEKNLGESQIRDAMMAKAEFLIRIGDKEGALTAFREAHDKMVTLDQRLDIVFYLLKIGLFYMDNNLIKSSFDEAKRLIKEDGARDRRNHLKVYQGLCCMATGDFKQAAELFLDAFSTFASNELMDYKTFVTYTVYVCMITLKMPDLKEKVIKRADIMKVLQNLPAVQQYLLSLYERRYSDFFRSLAAVEQEMEQNWLLAPHCRDYVTEMRIQVYGKLLEDYPSLPLDDMAQEVGVSRQVMEKELSEFIAAGRLQCKIDKVNGIVETNRPDST